MWGALAGLLALPAIAMRFTSEVDWTTFDFLVMGAMLGTVGLAIEGALRTSRDHAYRAAVGVAVVAAFLLTWANLAVGIIGNEQNPANLIFLGVIAVGVVGAFVARFRAAGMAWAMIATAVAQTFCAVAALVLDGAHVFVLTVGFVALWLGSAWLFGKAARAEIR